MTDFFLAYSERRFDDDAQLYFSWSFNACMNEYINNLKEKKSIPNHFKKRIEINLRLTIIDETKFFLAKAKAKSSVNIGNEIN